VDDERTKARVLRIIVVVAMSLGAAAVVLAMLPGVEVWAGGSVGWRRIDARSAAEHPWWMLAWGIVMLGPGVLVWFRPQLTFACLWSMIAFGATAMWFVATNDMPGRNTSMYMRYVDLWPSRWFGYIVVIVVGGLVVALPMFCAAFAVITGRRDGVRATLPTARIHRRS
jgi:hypothetical protein